SRLDLRNNLFQSLPNISQLKNLEVLNLKANELQQLPKDMEKLTALADLDVSMNYQTNLPFLLEQLKLIKQLKFLDVSYNKATPNQVEDLKAALPNTRVVALGK